MKFEDLNSNGKRDEGEPGIPEWPIELIKNGDPTGQVILTKKDGAWYSRRPMAAWTSEEEQRRRRRKRIVQRLLIGGAAIGVPALINAAIARRAKKVAPASWGRRHRYAWELGDVVFQRLGEGEPLLLLHSFGPGHDSIEWRAAAERLAAGCQVFAPDLSGWGRSDRALGRVRRRALHRVPDRLPGRRRAPAGGGRGLRPGGRLRPPGRGRPDRAGARADPGLPARHRSGERRARPERRGDPPAARLPLVGTSALNVYSSRNGLVHHLRREVYSDPDRVDEGLVGHYWRGAHEAGSRAALASSLSGYLNHRVADALRRLRQPALVVWGRRAVNPPVESADLWLHALPGAELEVVKGAGILPHAEAPEAFRDVAARLVDALPTA